MLSIGFVMRLGNRSNDLVSPRWRRKTTARPWRMKRDRDVYTIRGRFSGFLAIVQTDPGRELKVSLSPANVPAAARNLQVAIRRLSSSWPESPSSVNSGHYGKELWIVRFKHFLAQIHNSVIAEDDYNKNYTQTLHNIASVKSIN